jgi:hypothetical protein
VDADDLALRGSGVGVGDVGVSGGFAAGREAHQADALEPGAGQGREDLLDGGAQRGAQRRVAGLAVEVFLAFALPAASSLAKAMRVQ